MWQFFYQIYDENCQRKSQAERLGITEKSFDDDGTDKSKEFYSIGNKYQQIISTLVANGYNPNELNIYEASYFVEEIICNSFKKAISELNVYIDDGISENEMTNVIMNLNYSSFLSKIYNKINKEYNLQKEKKKNE